MEKENNEKQLVITGPEKILEAIRDFVLVLQDRARHYDQFDELFCHYELGGFNKKRKED